MNTIKFTHPEKPLMVAHRGVSGLETENTNAAFVAAGNRSYYGIETDVHRTLDGKYVTIHDDNTARVAIDKLVVEESTYDTLRGLLLKQKDGAKGRTDIRIPSLAEYISICKYYEKVCILELKNHFEKEDIDNICQIINDLGYLQGVVFISFDFDNLVQIKAKYPDHPVQFLTDKCDKALIQELTKYKMDLDIHFSGVNAEMVKACHEAGIQINCWTVDTLEEAERVTACGVDFITSNILE